MIRLLKTFGLLLVMCVASILLLSPFKVVEHFYGWQWSTALAGGIVVVLVWVLVGPTCRHDWEEIDSFLIDFGRNKVFIYRCVRCRKEKITFVRRGTS